MTINFKLRKGKDCYKMQVEFKPFSIPITIRGVTARFASVIQDRPLGICLQGTSIQKLEDRIEEFKDARICWGAMNRFDIYQEYILNKIDKKLSIVMDVGEVHYVEAYEKTLRIPRWKKFLENPEAILITSDEILQNIEKVSGWNIYNEHINQLIVIENCRKIKVPNSIMLYLMVLAKLNVKKVILFGFDGFGKPSAFKDTPVWNAEEMHYPEGVNKTLTAYYRKDSVLEERRIGYQDERASDLHSNSPTYNDQFRKTYGLFCQENNIPQSEIVNCSINALYTVHRKISYDQLHGELN